MSGPCLSSSVAGRPLRPATRHSLGEPLPHQLADRPRVHLGMTAYAVFSVPRMSSVAVCGINSTFAELSRAPRQITHVLRTLAPLNILNIATQNIPFDLHVLSTPPPFVLSQNQTLHYECLLSAAKAKRLLTIFPNTLVLGGLSFQFLLRIQCYPLNSLFNTFYQTLKEHTDLLYRHVCNF